MVEMYVWLLLTVVVAVGVLMLAGMILPGEPANDDAAEPDGSGESAPVASSAWTSMWRDFRTGISDVGARLARIGHLPRHRPERRSGAGSADAAPRQVWALRPESPAGGVRGASRSNTSIDDFFEATATSEPAYLDAAELSDALNHLRR